MASREIAKPNAVKATRPSSRRDFQISCATIDPHQGHLRNGRVASNCSRRSTKSGRSLPSRVGFPGRVPVPVLAALSFVGFGAQK
jgi:hypothetical protein